MNKNLVVHDLYGEQSLLSQYDLAFFALGYETRCTAVVHALLTKWKRKTLKKIVISFDDKSKNFEVNKKCYDSFSSDFNYMSFSADDDQDIYQLLRQETQELNKVSILIDYSSMSRIWYTAIINWAKLLSAEKEIIIDFIYNLGDYKTNDNPMVIQGISPVPGCEGSAPRQSESVAIFGLGFHGYTALCVLDQLEPDVVYALLAYPAGSDAYEKKSFDDNSDLLSKAQKQIKLPLHSVENTYRYLSEIVASELARHREVTLIPMGPKTHILSSILVALSFPEVTCLRVRHTNDSIDVIPRESFIFTRVTFENVQNT